jgi:hypothetical protein
MAWCSVRGSTGTTLIYFTFTKYYEVDKMKEDGTDETCNTHEVVINAYKIFVRKLERKSPSEKLNNRYKDNINVAFKGVRR